MAVDKFQAIAGDRLSLNKEKLSENPPMEINRRSVKVDENAKTPFCEPRKPYNKGELFEALAEERKKYEPYLRNLAPEIPVYNKIIELKKFTLDDEKEIEIPYYGGPIGNSQQKYSAEFEINEDISEKAVYICFGGADYHASVYINDYCVGMHEGFFSPFEFEITEQVKSGANKLKVILKNDHIYFGNNKENSKEELFGDKLYAATGLGYDEPVVGWHHCPAGMGIYNYVRVEIRNRLNITDLAVRPLPEQNKAEILIEVENADYIEKLPQFTISVYGQNFEKTVIKDSFHEAYFEYVRKDLAANHPALSGNKAFELYAMHGNNQYKIEIDIDDPMLWTNETPYLYQVQVVLGYDNKTCDAKKCQFGMRSFVQDMNSTPKGRFYLNGKQIKLRGANTMGFEQQDVMRGDFNQLIDDILLAKLCNMNFWRLTQRPVQDEVYEYCDKLGLMTQTDLPLFGVMRRNKTAEALRQTEEMIKMIRKHTCNVIISYINEPSYRADIRPHRFLNRNELEDFFESCDRIVKLNMQDCVIKHVDGDYEPPTRNSISDNHVYTLWYNGHEIEFGRLYRGYWVDTDREWCSGCGEYGVEALDDVDLMRRRYPSEWIKEPFTPANIVSCQAIGAYMNFFDEPESMQEWVSVTQEHQAFATKVMTETFRRNPDLITSAIHLFIDAWPSGWMKSIMDCERTPKKAYFSYRDSLAPVLISLRADRFTYYENEKISIETYISNDVDIAYKNCKVIYELYRNGCMIKRGSTKSDIKECDVTYVANAEFTVSDVKDREKCLLKAILVTENDEYISSNTFDFEVFRDVTVPENHNVVFFDNLDVGEYDIAGEKVVVSYLSEVQGDRRINFVSCKTGHKAVECFEKNDFRYWYDKEKDRISYITEKGIRAEGFNCVLKTHKGSPDDPYAVVCEKLHEGKRYIISTLDLREENPVAKRLKKELFEL